MSGPARRDLVWDAALRALVANPASIRLRDVQDLVVEDVSDRTVRRAMNSMQALGWLEKETEGSHYWLPGPKARQFLRVPAAQAAIYRGTSEAECEHDQVEGGCVEFDEGEVSDAGDDTVETLQDIVDDLSIPGGGVLEGRRRDVVLDVLLYLREQGQASPGELKERFYQPTGLDYSSAHSWWKNLIYPVLSEIPVVESGGEGSHKWFYVGHE